MWWLGEGMDLGRDRLGFGLGVVGWFGVVLGGRELALVD